MEGFIPLIVILLVGYGAYRIFKKPNKSISAAKAMPRRQSSRKRQNTDDGEWLQERWELADQQQLSGQSGMFPEWYFDPVTAAQLKRLKNENIRIKESTFTKGKASDVIGLTNRPDDHELEVLRFFKISIKGLNQTSARHLSQIKLQDEDALACWNGRPPNAQQKEYCRFFDIKLPKGTSLPEAQKILDDHESEIVETNESEYSDWEAYQDIMDEINDADFRSDCGIKKPSLTLIRKGIDSLLSEGKSYKDISGDVDDLVYRLIDLKPDLERN